MWGLNWNVLFLILESATRISNSKLATRNQQSFQMFLLLELYLLKRIDIYSAYTSVHFKKYYVDCTSEQLKKKISNKLIGVAELHFE